MALNYNMLIVQPSPEGVVNVTWNEVKEAMINGITVLLQDAISPSNVPASSGDDPAEVHFIYACMLGIDDDGGADKYMVGFTLLGEPGSSSAGELYAYSPDEKLHF